MNADDWSKEVDVTATKCKYFLGNRPASGKTRESEDAVYSLHTKPLLSDHHGSQPNESMFTSEKQTLVINSNKHCNGGIQDRDLLKPLQFNMDEVKRQSAQNLSKDFHDDMKRLIFTKQRISQNLSLSSTQIDFKLLQKNKEQANRSKERFLT